MTSAANPISKVYSTIPWPLSVKKRRVIVAPSSRNKRWGKSHATTFPVSEPEDLYSEGTEFAGNSLRKLSMSTVASYVVKSRCCLLCHSCIFSDVFLPEGKCRSKEIVRVFRWDTLTPVIFSFNV